MALGLAPILLRALQHDRERRWPDAASFATALTAVAARAAQLNERNGQATETNGAPAAASPTDTPKAVSSRAGGRRLLQRTGTRFALAALSLSIALVAGELIWRSWGNRGDQQTVATPPATEHMHVHRTCGQTAHYTNSQGYEQWVNACWGFDYRPPYYLRGYARLVAQGTDSANVALQIQPLVLGDGHQPAIAQGSSMHTESLDIDTSIGGVNNEGWANCSTQNPSAHYFTKLSFSVRYPDGHSFAYTTRSFDAPANGAPNGVCTPNYQWSNAVPYTIDPSQ